MTDKLEPKCTASGRRVLTTLPMEVRSSSGGSARLKKESLSALLFLFLPRFSVGVNPLRKALQKVIALVAADLEGCMLAVALALVGVARLQLGAGDVDYFCFFHLLKMPPFLGASSCC